jgi:alpha-methylacyl-CoA racemase
MLLADLGAEVIVVERVGARRPTDDAHGRGRRSIALDLKDKRGADILLDLVADADVLVEGFRAGVVERLGVGPSECLARNPRLVYARMTGWGQDGPLAAVAGHDINYLALSGALHAIGPEGGPPVPPLNLLADYGAGGLLLALGVVSAVLHARTSGRGQVIDAAMVDGLAAILAPFHAMAARGTWAPERGTNMLDGGAPFYGVYATKDGRWLAVGAVEPVFYKTLLEALGVEDELLAERLDRARWPEARRRLQDVFLTRTRDEWVEELSGREVCVQPVLDLAEARAHPHAKARSMFTDVGGVPHQAPAPRFSETVAAPVRAAEPVGASTTAVLTSLRVSPAEQAELRAAGVVS